MATQGQVGPAASQSGPVWSSADWVTWSRRCWRRHAAERPLVGAAIDDTLPALALRTATARPDRLAISVDGAQLTFRSLVDGAAVVAGWLAARLRLGARVLLVAPTSTNWVHAYLGVLTAGGVVVLANPSSTAAELRHLADDADVALVLAAAESLGRCAGLRVQVVDIDEKPWAGGVPASGVRAGLSPKSIALLGYTSGTTGAPKGVPLTHANLVSSISSALYAWGWRADDVVVHALPLYHQHGLGALHAALVTGSSAAVLSRFDTAALAAAARRYRASVLFAVPAIYRRLVAELDSLDPADAAALRSLRLRICGSAPLEPELAGQITDTLGGPALVRYGLTESGLDVSQVLGLPAPDSIGVPLPWVQLRLTADGRIVPPGVEGQVQLRGPQVFSGYWRKPEETAAAIDHDGWFSTGDIAVLDPDTDVLRIRGRSKELIISGGLNIYPREVEVALEKHPGVAEAGVAGVPDPRWGEVVTGWVVPTSRASAPDPDELIAHARTLLAPYKCPKQIFVVTDLPKTAMGKLQRSALRPPPAGGSAAR